MKRFICALLICLLALPAAAMAEFMEESQIGEAIMIYEDYDGQHVEQTVADAAELLELEGMLMRAAQNPAELQGNTMNCTLFCMMKNGDIFDFAIATDGSNFITDMNTDMTYTFEAEDLERFWEIFSEVKAVMGFNASEIWNW